ncbi:hypothetical protein ACL0VS_18010 [Chryseobacterium sp. PMSZPI]|uniref:hypothetical protein n=1 Tax=Chryseobacterium sp. PMSZPI TaxID=1033900 RepID=UPI0039A176D2
MNQDVLRTVLAIFNIALVALLNGKGFGLMESIKKRKLKIYLESKVLTDELDDDFKSRFIDSNVKEILFYLETGILTNAQSIPRFIELKEKLGGNFTWKDIRLVRWYVNTKDTGPLLNLSTVQKHIATAVVYFTLLAALVSVVEVFALTFIMDNIEPREYITLMIYTAVPLMAVLILSNQTAPITKAKTMVKVLEKQESQENSTHEYETKST